MQCALLKTILVLPNTTHKLLVYREAGVPLSYYCRGLRRNLYFRFQATADPVQEVMDPWFMHRLHPPLRPTLLDETLGHFDGLGIDATESTTRHPIHDRYPA